MQTSSTQNMSGAAQQTTKEGEGFLESQPSTDGQKLVDISIDEALMYIGKVDNTVFMREVQRMMFKVSFRWIFNIDFSLWTSIGSSS